MSEGTVIAPQQPPSDAPNLLARVPKRRERLEFALPTINVIFLLMLYFLLAGTIVEKNELGVAPPETKEVPSERLPRPLLVISDAQNMTLDGQNVPRAELVDAARAALAAGDDDLTLNVLAPATMPATTFLEIISNLSAADIPVRIVTVEKAVPGAS